jgi:hypothetical protein
MFNTLRPTSPSSKGSANISFAGNTDASRQVVDSLTLPEHLLAKIATFLPGSCMPELSLVNKQLY